MAEDKKLSQLDYVGVAQSNDSMYLITYENGVQVSKGIFVSDLFNDIPTGTNRVVSGQVVYTGTGLDFISVNLSYELNGVIYTSNGQTVTLDVADATNPRLDVLFVDATGLKKKTGVPSATPQEPTLDNPLIEIKTNLVLVNAQATEPEGITITTVYSENLQEVGGEWDTSENTSGVRIDLDSTDNPINLLVDIKSLNITIGLLDEFEFNTTSPIIKDTFNNLRLKIKSLKPDGWGQDVIVIGFYKGTTLQGNASIGLHNMNTSQVVYPQDVVIMNSDIGWLSTGDLDFDRLVFSFTNGTTEINPSKILFQMDLLEIESGNDTTNPTPPTGVPEAPLGGKQYGRQDGSWTEVTGSGTTEMDLMSNMTESKTTPIDADNLTLWDSVVGKFKKFSIANLIAYLNTIYQTITTPQKTITTNYTLTAADNGYLIIIDATAAITITVNSDLPDSFGCQFWGENIGAATFTEGTGIIYAADGAYVLEQNKVATLFKKGSENKNILKGELS